MVRNDSKSWVIVKPYKHVYTHTGTCTPAHSYVKAKVDMGREAGYVPKTGYSKRDLDSAGARSRTG